MVGRIRLTKLDHSAYCLLFSSVYKTLPLSQGNHFLLLQQSRVMLKYVDFMMQLVNKLSSWVQCVLESLNTRQSFMFLGQEWYIYVARLLIRY